MTSQVLTANRLRDGRIVYLARRGNWSESLDGASVARNDLEADLLLAQAGATVAENRIVGPYLMSIIETSKGLIPQGQRETIRAQGPSIPSNFISERSG